MKYVFMSIFSLVIILITHQSIAMPSSSIQPTEIASDRTPQNAKKLSQCKIKTSMGNIIGKGASIHEARSQASEICFNRQLSYMESQRGSLPQGEQADMLIDACVNVRCQ